jgi:hypothetical protein
MLSRKLFAMAGARSPSKGFLKLNPVKTRESSLWKGTIPTKSHAE